MKQTEPRDTSPLELSQVSDDELQIILEIEERLREVQETAKGQPRGKKQRKSGRVQALQPQKDPFVQVQARYPRVLLLDGGRGTGKTSLLLTLAHHWNFFRRPTEYSAGVEDEVLPLGRDEAYSDRVERLNRADNSTVRSTVPPDFVQVIGRILDFDSLPSSMPLIAGIVQTCRQLAEKYDESDRTDQDCESRQTLQDRWHELFRVAVAGWGTLEPARGLVEQVLDREEQIQNWHCLDRQWQEFIDEVVEQERCHGEIDEPVFVIMIDDVDLQVERISELLPALRLLYHPNVVFVVAADREHMIDMLKLDFLGQQNLLSRHRFIGESSHDFADHDRYASRLAISAVQKVFPNRNSWKLNWLSLEDFLRFPSYGGAEETPSFGTMLDDIKRTKETEPLDETRQDRLEIQSVADLLRIMARPAKEAHLPGIMTFRSAHHLYYSVQDKPQVRRAYEVLQGLLSGSSGRKARLEEYSNEVESSVSGTTVELLEYGELGAVFQPTLLGPGTSNDVLLSSRPDFIFNELGRDLTVTMRGERQNEFSFLTALVAKSLEELYFPVSAPGLRWENYLSLVWTEWKVPRRLLFAWDVVRHPRPDELLRWVEDWKKVLSAAHLEFRDRYRFDRYMYAWIYYQKKWNDLELGEGVRIEQVLRGGTQDEVDFGDLVRWCGRRTLDNEDAAAEEAKKWEKLTIPLLARPELGVSPAVQEQLLANVEEEEDLRLLRSVRRRKITDAFYTTNLAERSSPLTQGDPATTQTEVQNIIDAIDQSYERIFGENFWMKTVEKTSLIT